MTPLEQQIYRVLDAFEAAADRHWGKAEARAPEGKSIGAVTSAKRVAEHLKQNPDAKNAEVVAMLGVSEHTVISARKASGVTAPHVRVTAEKRERVLRAMAEHPDLGSTAISRLCRVSQQFAGRIMRDVKTQEESK